MFGGSVPQLGIGKQRQLKTRMTKYCMLQYCFKFLNSHANTWCQLIFKLETCLYLSLTSLKDNFVCVSLVHLPINTQCNTGCWRVNIHRRTASFGRQKLVIGWCLLFRTLRHGVWTRTTSCKQSSPLLPLRLNKKLSIYLLHERQPQLTTMTALSQTQVLSSCNVCNGACTLYTDSNRTLSALFLQHVAACIVEL